MLDAEPRSRRPGSPSSRGPTSTSCSGSWWSEGSPITFFVREGELWSRLADDDPLRETRFAAEGTDRFRAVARAASAASCSRWCAPPTASVDRLYFATYAVTREPLAFADLT